MWHLCGWQKLNLKKCVVRKIKNTEWSAMSVGSVAVQLKYGLYVGHLSKWFVFVLMFIFWLVSCLLNGRPTIGYNYVIEDHFASFNRKIND
ncbi:hypothetical protein AEM51_07280 [Bacteroidetes bacterium UKL13-3]|nr:hypothetical protein AEM51_07280 [Bacteroidetes bacterium UKL13-3]